MATITGVEVIDVRFRLSSIDQSTASAARGN